jgi:IS30 family transposase
MSAIATIINRSKSTISRELKRNTGDIYKIYLPDTAEEKMKVGREKSKKRFQKIDGTTIKEIKQRLE